MLHHVVVVCACSHLKREHLNTKQRPTGPCTACECSAFMPESQCDTAKCGHGRKAHRKGRCHECGCTQFKPKPSGDARKGS